jgi:hypothetical protein
MLSGVWSPWNTTTHQHDMPIGEVDETDMEEGNNKNKHVLDKG